MESIKTDSDLFVDTPAQQSSKINRICPKSPQNAIRDVSWVVDGVAFPNGTKFRCKYKGCFYYAKVTNGALMINGKEFLSPTAAAVTITRNAVDGWLFWDCQLPGNSSWVNICALKQTN